MDDGLTNKWPQLEALFLAASELPPEEQDAFIDREGADPALAAAIRGMLAAGRRTNPIGRIIESAAQSLSPDESWIGRQLGPYRIVREIGRGGMGLVFEAVRNDDEYRKRVALKVAPWWRDSPESRARFLTERQLLAELEHPNIARFLDGGTEHGTPYFVMEYVEGVPITAYCDERKLDLRARLALFRTLCEAVDFAHERLIVHRDIKPANILVGTDGVPKLLDFGIAKLLDPKADPGLTVSGSMWTPDYASPEQARGQVVTTRTDVYSLGLVLYELLAGARAQVADTSSALALERSISDIVPALPSVKAAERDGSRARTLRGDLDTIVMTAISKEPERRYGSVATLADDITRYLDRRPIVARPSTIGYRARKFLRRHWTAAAATAIVVIIAAGGVVSTLYQARRAERRFNEVRTLANTFVFDVHSRIENLPGATEARKMIVQTALTYLERLREEAGGDAALSRELAAAYIKVGDVQGNPLNSNLGDPAGAIESYNRAEQLLSPLAARADDEATRALALVERVRANVLQARGDMPAAVAGLQRSFELGRTLERRNPRDAEALKIQIEAASTLSRTAVTARNLAVAERAGQDAVEASQRIVALDPTAKDVRDGVATAYNALGGLQMLSGKLSEAAETFKASVAIREKLVADEPENANWRRNLMISLGNLGDVLASRADNIGDRSGGLAALERTVALAEWAIEKDPADRRAPFDAASALLRRGGVRSEDPATVEAGIADLRRAEGLVASLIRIDPKSERYGYLAFAIDVRLGKALARGNHAGDALAVFERARVSGLRYMKGGVYQSTAHAATVDATVEIAKLRARTGDLRVFELIDFAARELAKPGFDRPADGAAFHADLGRVYLAMARSHPDRRPELITKGRESLEASAQRWRDSPLHPSFDARRRDALIAIEAELAGLPALTATRTIRPVQ